MLPSEYFDTLSWSLESDFHSLREIGKGKCVAEMGGRDIVVWCSEDAISHGEACTFQLQLSYSTTAR